MTKIDIAVIPAKAFSRRLPNKNIKKFFGKPIISYAILKAVKSKCFKKIFVSTDSEKIRNISLKYGADTFKLRSSKYTKDKTTLLDLMSYECKRIKKQYPLVRNICCILPTALFFNIKQLKKKKTLNNKKYKKFLVCSESNGLSKTFFIKKNKIKITNKMFLKKNSQFLPKFYIDAGQFYYSRIESWIKKRDIFDNNCNLIKVPSNKFVDINYPSDWKKAIKIFKK